MATPDDALVLSVVSHGQRDLLLELLGDLEANVRTPFRLIVTENIPEHPALSLAPYSFPVEVIRNPHPKGFGANHNAAFERAGDGLFCVINPDIRLPKDPFPALSALLADQRMGVVAPAVVAPDLSPEDHARDFPSVFTLAAKALGYKPALATHEGTRFIHPDWVAGMFMLFRSAVLREVNGFDERYFLYYEDVDLCARLRARGYEIAVGSAAQVIHNARRESRRNARYALWHLRSALRFLASQPRIALGLGRQRPAGAFRP